MMLGEKLRVELATSDLASIIIIKLFIIRKKVFSLLTFNFNMVPKSLKDKMHAKASTASLLITNMQAEYRRRSTGLLGSISFLSLPQVLHMMQKV
jgi:hypothetical protein